MEFNLNDVLTGLSEDASVTTETPAPEPDAPPAEPVAPPAEASPAEPTPDESQEFAIDVPDMSERERALLSRIESMTEERLRQTTVPDPADTQPRTPEPVEHNYLDGHDLDEVLSDSTNLNRVLLSVHNRVLADASRMTAENIMRSLPRVIAQYVNNHMAMAQMVTEFYDTNPDLKAVKRTVAAVANDIAAQNPELTTPELFKRAGARTREILRLKQTTPNGRTTTPRTNPAFARQKGRAIVPELTGIEKEIDDLLMR